MLASTLTHSSARTGPWLSQAPTALSGSRRLSLSLSLWQRLTDFQPEPPSHFLGARVLLSRDTLALSAPSVSHRGRLWRRYPLRDRESQPLALPHTAPTPVWTGAGLHAP
eukprot:1372109-Rhodomonas_salina.1